VSTGKSDKETIVGYPELVASLAATLKQTPFELSDKASETSWRRVDEFEFILNITLGVNVRGGEYRATTDQCGSSSLPARLPGPASECLWEMLGQTPERAKPGKMIARGSKRTERKGKRGVDPKGWLPAGFPSHLHQTSIGNVNN